jgi:class 3 adenylate cyclase
MNTDPSATGGTRSQRSLAAIVFTDVVSFSARMHADEVGTLKLLERDFAEMRRLCTEHEGEVLKTTGDGLLLTFVSAVQAVACALAMQRRFAAAAKDQAPGGALQHRIGIHLGDVLIQDRDVMGDGVNIASRLQAEAEPGGICISQTVYDVVKNKLAMQVVSLGARELKNISSAVPVYRLLLEAQGLEPAATVSPGSGRPGGGGRRRVLAFVGGAAALVVVLGAVALLTRRNHAAPASPAPAAPAPAQPPGVAASNPPAAVSSDAGNRKDLMAQMHALYLDRYDFNGMVIALRDRGENPAAPLFLQQTLHAGEQLARMKIWIEGALRRHSAKRPLVVQNLAGDSARDQSVYLADDGRIARLENGSPKLRDWNEFKPAEVGAIVVSAVREAKETPRLVFMGAQAFARIYALPAMAQALDSIRTERTKDSAPR